MSRTRPSLVDELWLETLERSFAQHAEGADHIDVAKLQIALGLRSEYLARRVLLRFDQDGDGLISRQEFVAGVRKLILGTDSEKLRFVFQLHDEDGNGFIGPTELLRMISLGLAEDEVVTDPDEPRRLAHLLFVMADLNRDGQISFEEFETLARAHPQVLQKMTRSEASWISPNEDLLARLERPRDPRARRIGRLLENRWHGLTFLLLWLLSTAAVFVASWSTSAAEAGCPLPVRIGRGFGACLNWNGALILVPVMRRLLTWVRASWLGRAIPIDEALGFHRLVGHSLVAFGFLHAAAFTYSYTLGHPSSSLGRLLLLTGPGVTGVVLLVVLAVMWSFSRTAVRRSSRFELFYFTHLLYLVWFAVAVIHAPSFIPWVALPLLGWAVEQVLRRRQRARSSVVLSAQALRSGVTRLELERPANFPQRAGDYLFLCIPAIARHEWHPFTISSAPESPTLSVHVRSLGNWTSALRRRVEQDHATGASEPLLAQLDGAYGSPSTEIFESRFAVLIGAGIGVTPFASVLESLVLRANGKSEQPCRLQKVHFFWLNRDQYSFEWFDALLSQLESADHAHLLDVHICMTGGHTGASSAGLEIARDLLHAVGQRDVVTGLRALTQMGHPDWVSVLQQIAEQHAPEAVDVYFCGPAGLARKVRAAAARAGMRFRQEQF